MTAIACRQLSPTIADLTGNHELIVDAIAEATGSGADIVVLPELATSGYMFDSPTEARACAVTVADPQVSAWSSAITGDSVAVVGFAELGQDGAVYNSAAVVDRDGVRAVYRKAHLWDREKLVFQPGSYTPPVIDTLHGRIAVMICYDLEFPEFTRLTALTGADLLAVPTNWPLVERPTGERPPEVLLGQAAARVNHLAVACCDRSGTERGQQWTHGTTIIDHHGWIVTGVGGDQTVELDLTLGRNKRLTEHSDLFLDRRTDLYGALVVGPRQH